MTLMAPKDENELQHMLATAIDLGRPAAIRYPRGNGYGVPLDQNLKLIPLGSAETLREGVDGAVLALGSMVMPTMEAAALLEEQLGVHLTIVNARFVKPLDAALVLDLARKHRILITIEENTLQGGFGSSILELLEEHELRGTRVLRLGYPDSAIPQGEQHELRALLGLDPAGIAASISTFLSRS
jgi:1-deoxy-D-xylulose-5-phosphate synthase